MPSAQPEFDVAFRTSKVYTFRLADTTVVLIDAVPFPNDQFWAPWP
jgi:hypothetical protein